MSKVNPAALMAYISSAEGIGSQASDHHPDSHAATVMQPRYFWSLCRKPVFVYANQLFSPRANSDDNCLGRWQGPLLCSKLERVEVSVVTMLLTH